MVSAANPDFHDGEAVQETKMKAHIKYGAHKNWASSSILQKEKKNCNLTTMSF